MIADIKSLAAELYDVESRPDKVKAALIKVGAIAALEKIGVNGSSEKVVETLASMSTVAGLKLKKDEVVEIATPYIEKVRDPDGRAELVETVKNSETVEKGKAMITENVVEPVSAKLAAGKEFAAPYVASAKEYTDPYVAKLTELRNSERVESMIVAFQQAREHPAEKVGELRAKAVDLIRYENIMAYRDHVMSAEFQADTIQLVKVDLPAIATSAAKRGAEGVKATATTFKEEMDKYSEKVIALVPSEAEIKAAAEKVKLTGAALLAELQTELASGVQHVKSEGFSLDDTIERLKRVVGLVDKMVVAPLIEKVKAPEGDVPTGEAVEEPAADDEEPMEDAQVPPAAAAPATAERGRKDGVALAVASTVAVAVAVGVTAASSSVAEGM